MIRYLERGSDLADDERCDDELQAQDSEGSNQPHHEAPLETSNNITKSKSKWTVIIQSAYSLITIFFGNINQYLCMIKINMLT